MEAEQDSPKSPSRRRNRVDESEQLPLATGQETEMLLDAPGEKPTQPYLRVMSGQEFNSMFHGGSPPTSDDVPITRDGRRLDTKEKVLSFLAELDNAS